MVLKLIFATTFFSLLVAALGSENTTLVLTANATSACPFMWKQFQDKCYLIVKPRQIYRHAKDMCAKFGRNSKLYEPRDEDNWLETRKFFASQGADYYWLGMLKVITDNVNGDGYYVYQSDGRNISFSRWDDIGIPYHLRKVRFWNGDRYKGVPSDAISWRMGTNREDRHTHTNTLYKAFNLHGYTVWNDMEGDTAPHAVGKQRFFFDSYGLARCVYEGYGRTLHSWHISYCNFGGQPYICEAPLNN